MLGNLIFAYWLALGVALLFNFCAAELREPPLEA